MKKIILIGISILLIVPLLVLFFTNPHVQLYLSMRAYTATIEDGPTDDIRLIIYFLASDTLTQYPWSTEDLLRGYDGKITVSAEELEEHWELLKELKSSAMQPAEEKEHMGIRVYYVFETAESENLLDVAISYPGDNVWVNGVEVEYNPIFVEVLKPYFDYWGEGNEYSFGALWENPEDCVIPYERP